MSEGPEFYKGWAEDAGRAAGLAERGLRYRVGGDEPAARKSSGNRGTNIDEMLREGRIGVDKAIRIGACKPLAKTEDDNGDGHLE